MTLRSCIACSSAACVFGGVRLISSASMRLAKIGPCRNLSRRWTRAGSPSASISCSTSVPVMSAGKKIGRELHASERQIERLRERRDEQRLGEPRHAYEQRVPARRERHQHRLDHALLPHDGGGDGFSELRRGIGGPLEKSEIGRGSGRSSESAIGHCRCRVFSTTPPPRMKMIIRRAI